MPQKTETLKQPLRQELKCRAVAFQQNFEDKGARRNIVFLIIQALMLKPYSTQYRNPHSNLLKKNPFILNPGFSFTITPKPAARISAAMEKATPHTDRGCEGMSPSFWALGLQGFAV